MSNATAQLGELTVHRIGFGAMQLAGPGVFGPPADPDGARAVLRRAVELGVDHVDTAQFYGPDVVNDLIREALHSYDADLRLVTKVGARRDAEGAWIPAGRPEELVEQVEANLRALGTASLAAVNLRRFEKQEPEADAPLDDQLAALVRLRDEGKIQGIGVSNVGLETVQRAIDTVGIVCVQNAFGILDQSDRAVLDLTREHGVAYVPFFPLGSAFTGGPAVIAADPTIQEVAARHGATATQVALAWVLAQGEHVLLIPGTRSVAHLEENLAVADVELSDEDLAALATVDAGPLTSH